MLRSQPMNVFIGWLHVFCEVILVYVAYPWD